jgi:2-methylcitrate dehydratase PrpD
MSPTTNSPFTGQDAHVPENSSRMLARAGRVHAEAADEVALESARLILIDSLACAAKAADSTVGVQLLRGREAGEYPVDTRAARIANLIHLEEFDCLHDASATAPGVVVAAAAEVGLLVGAPTQEVLRAIVAGVEVTVQLGAVLGGPGMYAEGYWPSSLCAKVGVAAAVSRLTGLGEAATAQAIAIAAITGPSVLPRTICDAHYLSSGVAADLGIRSAYWAKTGIGAYDPILDDGPFSIDRDKLDISGDRAPRVAEVAFKRYPCARPLHAVIDAIWLLIARADIDADEVTAVTVSLPSAVVPFVNRQIDPAVEVLRRSSLDYVVGLALLDRATDLSAYRDLLADRPRIDVDLEIGDSEVEAMYPMQWSARVAIRVGEDVHTVLQGSAGTAHPGGQPLAWLTAKWLELGQNADWLERLLQASGSSPFESIRPLEIVQVSR